MRSDRLARCPFCGGTARLWHGIGVHAECNRCHARFYPAASDKEAIRLWNRRNQRNLSTRIEHAIYDFVVRSYGKSEAHSPSWSIPDLARSVTKDILNQSYRPENKITYEWEET